MFSNVFFMETLHLFNTQKPNPVWSQALMQVVGGLVPWIIRMGPVMYAGAYFLYTIYRVFPLSNNFDRVVFS
jgi:hypothetical protein